MKVRVKASMRRSLIERMRANIARFKAPREVVLMDERPEISPGNVEELELRESFARQEPAVMG